MCPACVRRVPCVQSDMYSVGVVALELFAVTRTRFELLTLVQCLCLQRAPAPLNSDCISSIAVQSNYSTKEYILYCSE